MKLTKVHLSNASLSEQQKLSFVFDKWRLLSLINRLQNGGSVEPDFCTDLLSRCHDRLEKLANDKIESLESEVKTLKKEKSKLKTTTEEAETRMATM